MIIQNEPKKIAVTEAQMSALRNAYKSQMVQANEVVGTPETNENIINRHWRRRSQRTHCCPQLGSILRCEFFTEYCIFYSSCHSFFHSIIIEESKELAPF